MGEKDKHLDFKVSLFINEKNRRELSISTIVKYHNTLGKIYFFVVKPFHKIIVKSIMKNMLHNLDISRGVEE